MINAVIKTIFFIFPFYYMTNTYASIDPLILERVNKALAPQIGTRVMGTIVGIYDHGPTQYLSFGMKSQESLSPDEHTFFEIGSLTKTFTSLLFSIAIDKGLVTPETTLAELRPEWKNQKLGGITLIELATHRSGLPRLPCNLEIEDLHNPYAHYTEEQLIQSITEDTLTSLPECKPQTHPTEKILYSNWGSALLGNALSAKSNLSYGEMLRMWITIPLGMQETVIKLSAEQSLLLAQGFTPDLQPTGLWERIAMQGNGAILSTASDMMIYTKAMLHPETTPFASAIQRVQALQYDSIAYNWFVSPAGSLWHDGMTGGYSSLLKIYIKKDFAIFSLTNTSTALNCLIEAIEEIPCQP